MSAAPFEFRARRRRRKIPAPERSGEALDGGEPKNVEPGRATGGGEVGASGLMFWIARAGGQKVTIRTAQRAGRGLVPAIRTFFGGRCIFSRTPAGLVSGPE